MRLEDCRSSYLLKNFFYGRQRSLHCDRISAQLNKERKKGKYYPIFLTSIIFFFVSPMRNVYKF